ncbi:VCBS repeat-containing protein [Candidatus Uhrbacteria bacterium]|nr:VCBS repeat-containing protein [Candidatus Uhrbacteria bacterium]
MVRYTLSVCCLSFLIFLGSAFGVHAESSSKNYVRTASIYLQGGATLDAHTQELSAFDLIVIPVEVQVWNKSFFTTIRNLNPDIIILPYVATVSWNDAYWVDSLHQSMYSDIESDWWLKDGNGNQVSVWTNTRALNLNSDWVPYLAQHVKDVVLASGYWDGVYFDEVQDSISWVGSTDVNQDGQTDTASQADTLWAENYKELFQSTRELIGDDFIIMTNGSSNSDFFPYVNGRMFETFPSSHNTLSEWENMTGEYETVEQGVAYEPYNMINVNTDNTGGIGTEKDYQAVRFGLTTTLLGDGYFSYDESTYNHSVLWTYDEFGVYLGAPKTTRQNVFNPQQTSLDQGVWLREFEEGKVIVNATTTTQTIRLDGEFEKLHGIQDVSVNNGRIVTEVTIAPQDGVILLRPIEEILGATYINGAFARIYDFDGNTKRTGFFAYDNSQRGGSQVIHFDTNGDGAYETISADDTYVTIYNSDSSLHVKFAPYTETYSRGINISVGDIEDDGSIEIVTGTENGGGPQVRVFNADGVLINPGFFAYADSFRGGVNVAIGDLNGDNVKEIICGAGYNGGPHVRVFKKDGTLINPGFFAYDTAFRGGVNVAVGDVDGDGIDDIVTGPGLGGSPLARVYDRDGILKNEFYLFEASLHDGLEVVASDIDGDGIAEIIGLTADVFTLSSN